MSHVIEHFRDPIDVIKICRNTLSADGWLILETPAIPNFPDTDHMFFFTEISLDKMCAHVGFEKLAGFFCSPCDDDDVELNYIAAYKKIA